MSADPLWPGAWTTDWTGAGLWIGDVDAATGTLPAASPADLADAGRRAGEVLRLFLRRRALLRRLVGRLQGTDPETVGVGYDARGAPVLRTRPLPRRGAPSHPGLFLSVAARGTLAAFALSRDPVGIDLEPEVDPGPLDAVLTRAERELIAAAPALERPLLRLERWTAKEAYLKALGTGLARDPAAVAVVASAADGFDIRENRHQALARSRPLAEKAPARGQWFRLVLRDRPWLVAVCRRGP